MNNKYLYLIIVILLGCFLLQFGCEKDAPEVKTDYSHIYKKIESDSLKMVDFMGKAYQDSLLKIEFKRKTDSITKVANRFIKLYSNASKIVYTQISEGVCDTNSVKILAHYCDSSIVALKAESAQKDTTIKRQDDENLNLRDALKSSNDMNEATRQILKGQADNNKALKKELETVKRKNKIKTTLLIIGDVLKDALLIFALKK